MLSTSEQEVEVSSGIDAEVTIGNGEGTRLSPHPLRAAVLGEVHARPFTPIETPRRVLHFAFDTAGERAQPTARR